MTKERTGLVYGSLDALIMRTLLWGHRGQNEAVVSEEAAVSGQWPVISEKNNHYDCR